MLADMFKERKIVRESSPTDADETIRDDSRKFVDRNFPRKGLPRTPKPLEPDPERCLGLSAHPLVGDEDFDRHKFPLLLI